jgi:protein-tyrosine phosphatase
MIDIHCHLLPGLDDGPGDLEESLAMARMALADGIRAVVATPHAFNGVYFNSRETILERVSVLTRALTEHHIPLILLAGADIYFEEGLIHKLETQEVLPINQGKYFLLELPSQSVPFKANEIFFEIRVKGYFPIITHLERNHFIQKHPEMVGEWVKHGALIQITAASLTGGFGSKAYECSCRLLEQGWVDVIATDAHSVNRRPPVLSRGLKAAMEIIGPEDAYKMVNVYPEMILRTMPLPEKDFPPLSFSPPKRYFFSRLFS